MGAGLSIQPLLNARVGAALGHPVYAALFSVVGEHDLDGYAGAADAPRCAQRARARRAAALDPPGGVIGAFVVLVALMATPRLGAAITVALFIAGQLGTSLIIDHFGLLGVPERPLTLGRLAGVACLIAGVALIRWV